MPCRYVQEDACADREEQDRANARVSCFTARDRYGAPDDAGRLQADRMARVDPWVRADSSTAQKLQFVSSRRIGFKLLNCAFSLRVLTAILNCAFNWVLLAAEPSCTIGFLPRPSTRSRNLRSRWMPWRERSAIAARPRLCRLHAVSRRACLHSLWLWSRHQLRHQLRLRLQHLHGHRQQQQQPQNKHSRRACTLCPVQLLSHSSRPCPPHPMTPPPAAAALLSPWSW